VTFAAWREIVEGACLPALLATWPQLTAEPKSSINRSINQSINQSIIIIIIIVAVSILSSFEDHNDKQNTEPDIRDNLHHQIQRHGSFAVGVCHVACFYLVIVEEAMSLLLRCDTNLLVLRRQSVDVSTKLKNVTY
jgi:hypothetical protein